MGASGDEFKHYDSSLYKEILKNVTLGNFGIFTWSLKQINIFLISIGELDFVKQQIIKFKGGPEGGVIELFRVYCDFVEFFKISCKNPTLENEYLVAEKLKNLPSLKNDLF